jgi:hypothetical protein
MTCTMLVLLLVSVPVREHDFSVYYAANLSGAQRSQACTQARFSAL